jgi:hypothetical protein
MNHSTNSAAELDQTDEDFFCEVSDETLEAAAGIPIGGQGAHQAAAQKSQRPSVLPPRGFFMACSYACAAMPARKRLVPRRPAALHGEDPVLPVPGS